jgi:hypothetical protein
MRLIVSFNVTEYRSDAFLVTNADIKALPLPELRYDELETNVKLLTEETNGSVETFHKRNEELRTILEWLWKVAVRPVLKALNLLSKEPGRKPGGLPRIWWVTSGWSDSTPYRWP